MAQQNVIAVIWDFDKTLINGYMQEPIFKKYDVDPKKFWAEVNSLFSRYAEQGIKVNKDTIYLNHMITCTAQGIFHGLNNELLGQLGKELEFYPGAIEILKELKDEVASNPNYQSYGIHVEHYIVSTGLTAMIKGSAISKLIEEDGIWGCEFIESPLQSELGNPLEQGEKNIIQQPGYFIDNTSKTRALFEINKGANKHDYIDVNSKMDTKTRRVPFENMIYIADGPSDVPVFSVLKRYNGKTFAVYPKGDIKAFEQVDNLRKDGRIDMYAEADYTKNTTAYLWLMNKVKEIANSIYEINEEEIIRSVRKAPTHLV